MGKFTVVLSHEPSGWWVATCPATTGAVTQARGREEALAVISELVVDWLRDAHCNGYGPTPETPGLIAAEVQAVLAGRQEEGWDLAIETVVVDLSHVQAA
jgi:predicted RNase H-like HicB family nuclease